jgi:CBS domain-containing protein
MQLKEIMTRWDEVIRPDATRGIEVIRPDATIKAAADKMRYLDLGALPVCDGDRLVGMLTDRDIAVRAAAEGWDPMKTQVRDVMTPEVVFCFEDEDVEEAARLMEERQIRRLLILNREERLVGVVSLGDLAVGTGDERLAGEVLEHVSEPAAPKR